MIDAKPCVACAAPKAPHSCGLCHQALCKDCLQYVDTNSFSFLTRVPEKLKAGQYCPPCYDEHVMPEQQRYDELMEKAKDVYFLTKAYPGYVRVLRRHTRRIAIATCDDRRETILRLAFLAAELGFNAIIEAEVESTKVRKGAKNKSSYQTSTWSGSAMPANIDGEQLERSSLRRI